MEIFMNQKASTYYEMLEVSQWASQGEVTKAYLRLKAAYGKDSFAGYTVLNEKEREEYLKKIEEAYRVLSSTVKRHEYDQKQGLVRPLPGEQFIKPLGLRQHGIGRHFGAQKLEVKKEVAGIEQKPQPSRSLPEKKFIMDPQMEERIASQEHFTGAVLKEIREYRNMSLKEISSHTRIGINYLDALEEERFSEFPAPVYIRGFLAQYARCLKLDPIKVCQSYLGRLKEYVKVPQVK